MTKNIILIGGSGLIGRAVSEDLANKKYNVIVVDEKKTKIVKNIEFFKINITKVNSFEILINNIFKKYKRIDCVINCSYPKGKSWGKKFLNLKEKDLRENLYLQMGIPIIIAQIFIKKFLNQKYGNLIFFSSILGVQPPKFFHYDNTNMNSPIEYSASKAGIISITKYLAKAFGKKNIRANCISPGGIKVNQPKSFQRKYRKSCLTKGLLNPKDICGTVEFLLSDQSRYINGQNFIIDDGWSL